MTADYYNSHKPLSEHIVLLSKCCGAEIHACPPSLGDPQLDFCSKCSKGCEGEILPKYEQVSKGHYRIINHSK